MTRRFILVLFALVGWLALPAPAQAEGPKFPQLSGWVVDAANVIPSSPETRLTRVADGFQKLTQHQLVVVTVPDLQGDDIADYGARLSREWNLGTGERHDGVLLIVAPKEQKVQVEVGYDLKGTLTDALATQIIDQVIAPRLRNGDLPGGLTYGAETIVEILGMSESQVHLATSGYMDAPPTAAEQSEHTTWVWIGVAIAMVIIALVLFILYLFAKYGPKGSGGSSGGSALESLRDRAYSSSSYDSGFSGGGGSFGGGGASGSW